MENNEWTECGGWSDSFLNLNENESQIKNKQENGGGTSSCCPSAWNDTQKNPLQDYTAMVTNKV